MTITTTDLDCGGVPAYFARDAAKTDGGVLLLPSIHGREAYVMDYVHALAEVGFPTLMWDLFRGEGEAHTREERHARGARLSDAGSVRQMSRLVDHMTSELGLNQIVVLGFCLGGRYALLLGAHEPRLAGVVAYYPTIETPRLPSQKWDVVAQASGIACPVHLITPGIDHLTSRAVFDALQTSLQSRPALTSIQYFPQAEHAFLQTDRRLGPANEQAVGMSRSATFGFLNGVLRAKPKEALPARKARDSAG